MHVLTQVLWFALGIGLLVLVFDSVIRTFVLPRAATPIVTRAVFISLRSGFNLVARGARTYNGRDSVMALFGPIGLLMLPAVWSLMVLASYTAMFHALGVRGFERAFEMSGSSLFFVFIVPSPCQVRATPGLPSPCRQRWTFWCERKPVVLTRRGSERTARTD